MRYKLDSTGDTDLGKGRGFLSARVGRWLGERRFTVMWCQNMANMTWSHRVRNCKLCMNQDDMHADTSLKWYALPHKSLSLSRSSVLLNMKKTGKN